jgi:hypothetical protein
MRVAGAVSYDRQKPRWQLLSVSSTASGDNVQSRLHVMCKYRYNRHRGWACALRPGLKRCFIASLPESNLTDPALTGSKRSTVTHFTRDVIVWANGEAYNSAWKTVDDNYFSLELPYPSFPANYCTCTDTACSITGSWGAIIWQILR